MKELCAGHGARFAVVLSFGNAAYAEKLKALTLELGIPFFDLANDPRFLEEQKKSPLQFRYDGHWNSHGHTVAGDLIGEYVEGLLRPPSGQKVPFGK
jgi:hypothetical protein